jgi:hypothetical protein
MQAIISPSGPNSKTTILCILYEYDYKPLIGQSTILRFRISSPSKPCPLGIVNMPQDGRFATPPSLVATSSHTGERSKRSINC